MIRMLTAATALVIASSAGAQSTDKEMVALASHSGCLTCHSLQPAKEGSAKPVGPNWNDVATKYKDQPKAEEQLVHTVMTGSSPYSSHWKGKVSGLAMPPNEVAINEADARKLVHWILNR
jgi:cytochrome c